MSCGFATAHDFAVVFSNFNVLFSFGFGGRSRVPVGWLVGCMGCCMWGGLGRVVVVRFQFVDSWDSHARSDVAAYVVSACYAQGCALEMLVCCSGWGGEGGASHVLGSCTGIF